MVDPAPDSRIEHLIIRQDEQAGTLAQVQGELSELVRISAADAEVRRLRIRLEQFEARLNQLEQFEARLNQLEHGRD